MYVAYRLIISNTDLNILMFNLIMCSSFVEGKFELVSIMVSDNVGPTFSILLCIQDGSAPLVQYQNKRFKLGVS